MPWIVLLGAGDGSTPRRALGPFYTQGHAQAVAEDEARDGDWTLLPLEPPIKRAPR